MKVLYFMDNSATLGGAAYTLLRQVELMRAAGHEAVVALDSLNREAAAGYQKLCLQRGIAFSYIPFRVTNQPEDIDIIFLIEQFDTIREKIAEEQPDILHSVQLNPAVELVARELNIPHVMSIYPAIPDFFKLAYTDVFPKYHICDSEYYAAIWRKYLDTESVCIRTVAKRGSQSKGILVSGKTIRCVCVGSVYKWKNQLSVIKACHRALKSGIDISLYLYGYYEEDGYGGECLSYIRNHELNGKIELKGFSDNMATVYQYSDVLICGSMRESYPNVISEALANDVVVISTPVAGVPEVIKDRENGYLCKGYTLDDIYEKIVELNGDIENGNIQGIRQRAYTTYEEVHSSEKVTFSLEQYYDSLVGNYECKPPVSVLELKNLFGEIFQKFYENQTAFSSPATVGKKLWYLYHIKDDMERQIAQGRNFYIWGVGAYGRRVYEMVTVFFPTMNVAGFMDSFQTGQMYGKVILNPEDVLTDDGNVVLVAALNGQAEIITQLERFQKKYIDDYYVLAKRYW